jgi:FeS assembly protein IscX
MKLTWTDTRDLAIALYEAHPDVKPLTLRFTDLHRMVCALPGFVGDPAASNEKVLEAIQMVWLDESED